MGRKKIGEVVFVEWSSTNNNNNNIGSTHDHHNKNTPAPETIVLTGGDVNATMIVLFYVCWQAWHYKYMHGAQMEKKCTVTSVWGGATSGTAFLGTDWARPMM